MPARQDVRSALTLDLTATKRAGVRTYPDDDMPPRPSELEPLAADVVYEYDRFLWAANELLKNELHGKKRDAFVEVLLLHQRNLVAFFKGVQDRDDVTAQHYAPHWTPTGESWQWLLDRQRSAHKRLAHITAYRQRVPKQVDARDVREVRRHVSKTWNQFATNAAPRWGDRFRIGM